MIKQSDWVRSYTNIALIKYWGKENSELKIPMNNSLSLTLDAFYTETKVSFDPDLSEDKLTIDGEQQDPASLKKAQIILDLVREQAGFASKASIESINHVPTAAGLASSASGLAALAGAASQAANLSLSEKELSILARRGSGSASRSIYGGFVEWEKGYSNETSYSYQVDQANWDIGMLFIIVEDAKKDVSSSTGMKRTVETSPFYSVWLDTLDEDLSDIKQAIKDQDVFKVGEIAERNALKMHATNLGAKPPFTYWTADSIRAMDSVRKLRKEGYPVHFTMDAGPNVKLIGKASELEEIREKLLEEFSSDQLVIAKAGPGMKIV